MLVDRIKRMPMLAVSIVLWSVASLVSAFAGSYSSLLLTRLAAGRGDRHRGAGDRLADRRLLPGPRARAGVRLHPGRRDRGHRGRVHRQRQRGQPDRLAGGVRPAGDPGLLPGPELWRTVPEPLRGGQSRLEPGVVDLHRRPPRGLGAEATLAGEERAVRGRRPRRTTSAFEAVRRRGRRGPTRSSSSTEDPRDMPVARGGPVHPLDPDQRDADHRLLAGLLLLRRAVRRSRCCSSAATTTPARPPPSWCWRCWSWAR